MDNSCAGSDGTCVATVCCTLPFSFYGVRPIFKEGFSPPHPAPSLTVSFLPSSFKCQVCFSFGKPAKHYKFTLKESLPAAGRVRECLHTSVKRTTFFLLSVFPLHFYVFMFSFFFKKKNAIWRLTARSFSPADGGGSFVKIIYS